MKPSFVKSLLVLLVALSMVIPTAAFASEDDSDDKTVTEETSDEDSRSCGDDSKDGDTEDGDSEDGDAKDGDSEDGDTEDGDSEDGDTEDGDSEDGDAKDEDDGDVAGPEPVTIGEVTSTLPVLGAGLTVSITVGEDGCISEVAFDPENGEITKETPHKVVFELEDGETTVIVHAGSRTARTTVKTNDVANITGPGVWSSDVFGNGVIAVNYEVGTAEDGSPMLTIGDVTAPEGVTIDIADRTQVGNSGKKAGAMVRLSYERQTATVWLRVWVKTYDDGTQRAVLSVGIWPGRRAHLGEDHPGRGNDRGDDADDRKNNGNGNGNNGNKNDEKNDGNGNGNGNNGNGNGRGNGGK